MLNFLIKDSSTNESKIITQTRKGNNIDNYQSSLISNTVLGQAKIIKKRYSLAKFRTTACSFYNCHGLTFASRRTSVHEPSEIQKIIQDDNYSEISQENLLEGDAIIYYQDGDAIHSGVVLRVEEIGSTKIPLILSKWGHLHEVVHRESYCPYFDGSTIKYYRVKGTVKET
jgi:hypothetical protein